MKRDSPLFLAFLTATAAAVYIVESLIMSVSPLPFLRIGLSNVILLYLVFERKILSAFIVSISKSIIGGIATFSLLSPVLPLSLAGGIAAIIAMSLGLLVRPRFSMFGISILGAIAHNFAQLLVVRSFIIQKDALFRLTPLLILLGLFSGVITAYFCMYILEKIPGWKAEK